MFTNTAGELCVTLRGSAEDRILTSVRGWPYWLRADIERDPVDRTRCTAVTLITLQDNESTIREILKRGFGLIFPTDGGSQELPPELPAKQRSRGGR